VSCATLAVLRAQTPKICHLRQDILQEGHWFGGEKAPTLRAFVQLDRGIPGVQETQIAQILDFDCTGGG
jgi:hypothetical protein